ncbi:MAG TPA: HAMP domain-containing sensor histidine kinase [Polyangia bacterium]|nr:HAMP domain-containing sensor histidine kinase [Polyangia bacterium]
MSPLAAIRLIVQRLVSQLRGGDRPSDDELLDFVRRIDRLAAKANTIVDELRVDDAHATRDGLPIGQADVDVEDVVGEAIAIHAEALARAGCSVFVSRQDGLKRLRGRWDRRALERLFSNLFQNVARHAPGAPIEVIFSRRRDRLHVHFADRGPGMRPAPDGTRRVREPAEPGRHGLGLHIIQSAVVELKGHVSLRSAPGAGTVYDIDLPFLAADDDG